MLAEKLRRLEGHIVFLQNTNLSVTPVWDALQQSSYVVTQSLLSSSNSSLE